MGVLEVAIGARISGSGFKVIWSWTLLNIRFRSESTSVNMSFSLYSVNSLQASISTVTGDVFWSHDKGDLGYIKEFLSKALQPVSTVQACK